MLSLLKFSQKCLGLLKAGPCYLPKITSKRQKIFLNKDLLTSFWGLFKSCCIIFKDKGNNPSDQTMEKIFPNLKKGNEMRMVLTTTKAFQWYGLRACGLTAGILMMSQMGRMHSSPCLNGDLTFPWGHHFPASLSSGGGPGGGWVPLCSTRLPSEHSHSLSQSSSAFNLRSSWHFFNLVNVCVYTLICF